MSVSVHGRVLVSVVAYKVHKRASDTPSLMACYELSDMGALQAWNTLNHQAISPATVFPMLLKSLKFYFPNLGV